MRYINPCVLLTYYVDFLATEVKEHFVQIQQGGLSTGETKGFADLASFYIRERQRDAAAAAETPVDRRDSSEMDV